jgi:predicted HicB family RNase H-like nuclease
MEQLSTKKPTRKQIIFDVSEEDHRLIKRMAIESKMTMREWIVTAMAESIKRTQQPDTNYVK